MPSFPQPFSAALGKAPQLSVAMLGLSVPISVALDNLLLLLPLLWLLFNPRRVLAAATAHPVGRASWLLFIALLAGTLYGQTALQPALGLLGKYADLAFIPAFMLLLSDAPTHRLAGHAFIGTMAITLLLSMLVGIGWMPVQPWMAAKAAVDNPCIFHSEITHNNMMAFAVFLALLHFREARSWPTRSLWGGFIALACYNILFMVDGRTGYLILFTLCGWFAWTILRTWMAGRGKAIKARHVLAVLMLTSSSVLVAFQTIAPLRDGVLQAVTDLKAWQPGQASEGSAGKRLDYYYNTLKFLKLQPVLGVGTGGFADAYQSQVQGTAMPPTHNPHNEYLMVAAQTGLVGLALLLYLFYTLWRTAPRLPTAFEQDAARGLVLAYLVNCMFNSALTDHSDGLFFAFMTAVLFANLKPAINSAKRVGRHG